MDLKYKPIGFFDSGVGGISVLKESVKLLPKENFLYYGDSKNAPYGIKTVDEVKSLTFKAVDFLIEKGVKAIVIACNTATSASIEDLRDTYDIPIIGIEPAVKPAVELNKKGKILIMATPMTLAEKKFKNLSHIYKQTANIEPIPCPKLVEYIEKGIVEGEDIEKYLLNKVEKYTKYPIASIVLGCTHFPFIKKTLSKIVGEKVEIIDGGLGTGKELKRKLLENNSLSDKKDHGKVTIYNSSLEDDIVNLSYNLLNSK
ncbi:glutamate racemase [Clostridium oceanicum]|uniref:Glutamate racemase n=1 Tax=Clostridium oceanicum TaxID=1543 RepID=A0ABN1JRR4_9CLOT